MVPGCGIAPVNTNPWGLASPGTIAHRLVRGVKHLPAKAAEAFYHRVVKPAFCAISKHPALVAVGALGIVIATGGGALFVYGLGLSAEAAEGSSLLAEVGAEEAGHMMLVGGGTLGSGGVGLAGVGFSMGSC